MDMRFLFGLLYFICVTNAAAKHNGCNLPRHGTSTDGQMVVLPVNQRQTIHVDSSMLYFSSRTQLHLFEIRRSCESSALCLNITCESRKLS